MAGATPEGFATPGAIGNARVNEIVVRASGPGAYGFQNSYIVGGTIDFVRLTNPDFLSDGDPFGVAGDSIRRVDVVSPQLTRSFQSLGAGVVVSDFLEIRPGFAAPA